MGSRTGNLRKVAIAGLSSVIIGGMAAWPPPAAAQFILVDTTDDEINSDAFCSLREAIISANTNSASSACAQGSGTETDLIAVQAGNYELGIPGVGEDAAATGDLDITERVHITGQPGTLDVTVDGNGLDRVFDVRANTRFSFFEITGGTLTASPGDEGGGGVRYFQRLTMNDMLVKQNAMVGGTGADYGGGIGSGFATGMHLELVRTTVMENFAELGGGISGGGTFHVKSSLVQRNTAGSGGAVWNDGVMRLDNVTVTDNLATTGVGGLRNASGSLYIRNSTIATNQAGATSRAANVDGVGGTTTEAKNTIIAKPRVGPNCEPGITSNGHNLEDSNTCGFTRGSDIRNRNSRLRDLRNNGGITRTHAIKPSSPARNAGGSCLGSDQRGAPRPGSRCDIGAYELVRCAGVIVNRVGTRFNDFLTGTPGNDGFLALDAADDLNGRGGADALCGGKGTDVLRGSAGNDTLLGGNGADALRGGPGSDVCLGGAGSDSASNCEFRDGI